jgi:hypothetical protein
MEPADARDTIDIDAKVQKSLEGTPFASSSLKKLSGGSVNWIYHAKLAKPLEDGTLEVAVKHGERHMATKPDFELDLLRCVCNIIHLPRMHYRW